MTFFQRIAAALCFFLPVICTVCAEQSNLFPETELKKIARWNSGKGYRILPKGGRAGMDALLYERTNPKHYFLLAVPVKLDPGRYEFGGWVQCEKGISGNVDGSICMEISRNGKHHGGAYAHARGPGDWRHISGTLIVPPGKDIRVYFTAYMQKGNTGRVKFCDMYIHRAKPVVYASVLEPRMFHALRPGGNRLVIGTAVMNAPEDGWRLSLTLSGKNGKIAEQVFPEPAERLAAEFNFPAPGHYQLLCELQDRSGRKLAEDPIPLAAAESVPIGKCVSLDRKGRVLVNGKKFFPVGIFTHRKITAEHLSLEQELDLLSRGGFNCFLPYDGLEYRLPGDTSSNYGDALLKVMDRIQAADLKVLPSLDYVRKSDQMRMRSIVEKLRSHPALLGWYLYDEPPLRERTAIRNLCRELNLLDPAHPLLGVSLMPDGSPMYAGTANIYAYDSYPIYGHTKDILKLSANLKQFRNGIASGGGAPFWFAPQWFSWKCYYSAERTGDSYRWPSEDEGMAMALLALIRGANGLLFYSFFDLFKFNDFEKQWPGLCRIVKCMNAFAPFVLGDPKPLKPDVIKQSTNVLFRSFRSDDGRDAVAVVSLGGGKGELTLRLPGIWKSARGKTRITADGNICFSSDGIAGDILYKE